MTTSYQQANRKKIEDPSWIRKHGSKLTAVIFWLILIGSYALYLRQPEVTLRSSLNDLAVFMDSSAWGPIVYILIYLIRPLIFFPATLITLLSGFLFGPIAGIIYTVIGANGSAMLAYVVGRYFGQGVLSSEEGSTGIIQKYADRMRQNSFESILVMRLLFLPYDLVHYIAGFLRIDWRAFLLATIIGAVPGTISFVLLGSSFGTLTELLEGNVEPNPVAIGLSVGLIVISFAISRYLRQREARKASNSKS